MFIKMNFCLFLVLLSACHYSERRAASEHVAGSDIFVTPPSVTIPTETITTISTTTTIPQQAHENLDQEQQLECANAPYYVDCITERSYDPYQFIEFSPSVYQHLIIPAGKVLSFPLHFQNGNSASGVIYNSNVWLGQGGGNGLKWLSQSPGGAPIVGGTTSTGDSCAKGLATNDFPLGWTQVSVNTSYCFVGSNASVIYLNLAMVNSANNYPDARTAIINAIPSQLPTIQGAINNISNTPN